MRLVNVFLLKSLSGTQSIQAAALHRAQSTVAGTARKANRMTEYVKTIALLWPPICTGQGPVKFGQHYDAL